MIKETIAKIEARIREAPAVQDDNRDELVELLKTLREEVGELSSTHEEEADSITRFAHVSAHEATREGKNPALVDLSLKGLAASVDGFEESHPKLVSLVNRICTTLSNIGV